MEANTPGSEDPERISEPMRRVMDSLLEPHEGDIARGEEYRHLNPDEMETRLSELRSKLEDGTASKAELEAIDDLTIALKAAKRDLKSEDPDH